MVLELVATLFAGFSLVSYLCRKYPRILYGDIKATGPVCLHISHRGGAGENLENTMKAFDHAASLGTDMFEIDCQLTKDEYAMVAHDNNLCRLCGEDILISNTLYADLPPLSCTQRLDFDHRFEITKNIPKEERRILLLEDLFKKYPKMPMNVDIKSNNIKLVYIVNQLIQKYKRESITVWGNGSSSITKNIRPCNKNIYTLYTLPEILKTLLWYYTGLLPFLPLYANYYEIPMCSLFAERAETFPERAGTWWLKIVLSVLDPMITNEKIITHLKKRGVLTYFFVLNNEHEWRRALQCGASGIMTDFPTELKLYLDEHSVKTHSANCAKRKDS